MYEAAAFRDWFLGKGYKQNTYYTHNSYLKQIDQVAGGLDERIKRDGIEGVLAWARQENKGPFESYPIHSRSVLKKYVECIIEQASPSDPNENPAVDEELDPDPLLFRVEREMQAAVRKQLSALEVGLKEADGGTELSVATGRIDIVAEDAKGALVVIELKAGPCTPGALEQALGYAEALAVERGKPVRAYLIASEFSDRIRAAAKRVRDLELRTYEFTMQFHCTG